MLASSNRRIGVLRSGTTRERIRIIVSGSEAKFKAFKNLLTQRSLIQFGVRQTTPRLGVKSLGRETEEGRGVDQGGSIMSRAALKLCNLSEAC